MIMEETYEMFEFDQKMEHMMKLGYPIPCLELELKRDDFYHRASKIRKTHLKTRFSPSFLHEWNGRLQ